MTLYQSISARATTEWQPLLGHPQKLGFYVASGQIVFSTIIGYKGGSRLQAKLNAINANTAARGRK